MVTGHRTLHTKLLRDTRRQWAQSLSLVITVFLGVALFAASHDAYNNLQDSYAHVFTEQRFADLWAVTSGQTQAEQMARTLAEDSQVEAVAVRTTSDLPLRVGQDKLSGRVVGIPVGHQPDVDRLTILSGSYPAAEDEVAAEQHLADHFHLHPGSKLEVYGNDGWHQVTVSAVVSSAEYLWPARSRQEPLTTPEDFGVLFTPQPFIDAVAPTGTVQHQVQILLTEQARAGQGLTAVSAKADDLGATALTDRADQPSNSLLQEDISGFNQLSFMFPVLFLGAAGMAAYVLLTRRVDAEREVIGMLLASGMSRRTVLAHYLGYGLLVGTIGGALGVIAGEALARMVSRSYLAAIALPTSLEQLSVIRISTIVIGLLFGVLVGTLAALAPALRSARMTPAEAMRGFTGPQASSLSLAERILPPLRRAPVTVRLILRGIGRNRRRTTFTIVGVILSLLVILVSWIMLDTMTGMMNVQFTQVDKQDAQVELTVPVDSDTLTAIQQVPGVAEVEPSAQAPVALAAGGRSYQTVAIGLPTDTTMHGFRLAGGGTTSLTSLRGNEVLVGQAITGQLGVKAGDEMTVTAADGTARTVRIAALLDEPMGTYLYAPLPKFNEVAGNATTQSLLLSFTPGADPTQIRRTITDLPQVAAYQDSQSLRRSFDGLMGLFVAMISAMLLLGSLMAFAIIFTTMSVNILERQRELATLRTAGVRQRTIAELVAGENLLTTLLGVIPGLFVGVIGGKVFLDSYSNDQMNFDLVVRPSTLIISALAILVVAALSQWPGLRAIRRMDLAQSVRERSG